MCLSNFIIKITCIHNQENFEFRHYANCENWYLSLQREAGLILLKEMPPFYLTILQYNATV